MGTFSFQDISITAISNTASLNVWVAEYESTDLALSIGPSGSFFAECPVSIIVDDVVQGHMSGTTKFETDMVNSTISIEEVVPYEIYFFPAPPDEYNLEPTRFRKTYSYFRQRKRF